MTPPTPKLAAGAIARAETGDPAATAADAGPFVLNLCSSTTPMALAQTDLPELKRFTFFVSRRFEEGRERFRLHMGYFATQAEAEEWLGVVREIYPGAWAGEAQGMKLRARAAAAAAAQAQHAVGPQPTAAAAEAATPARSAVVARPAPPAANAPIMTTAKPPVSVPAVVAPTRSPQAAAAVPAASAAPVALPPAVPPSAASPEVRTAPALPPAAAQQARSAPPAPTGVPPISVPTLRAATPASTSSISSGPPALPPIAQPAPVQMPARAKTAPAAPAAAARSAAPQRPANSSNPASAASSPRVASGGTSIPTAARTSAPAGARPTAPSVQRGAPAAATAGSAVSATAGNAGRNGAQPSAGAQTGNAAKRPAAAAARTSASGKYPKPVFEDSNVREVLKSLDEETGETGETRMMPAPSIPRVEATDDSSLTDTQVLRFLENRREGDGRTNDVGDTGIALLKPDDTGTRRALKEAVTQNAPVSFAVQLQWSVQPVELDKVPPLAIFSAYTLYTVEGSRDGRKWYGLRLGFFSDAISAKQVAYYVRSEFASVAVVPVSPQERTRATDEDKKAATLAFPKKIRSEPIEEFKLIDPEVERANELAARSAQRSAAKPAAAAAAKPAPAQAAAAAVPAAKRTAPAKGGGGRVGARDKRGPQTLEETLEILGASELEIDSGRGESLNDTGVRHLRVQVQKNTPFTRLLERLSERIKKP